MSTPLRPVPTLVSRNSFHVLTVEEIEDIPHSETKLVLPSEQIIKPVSRVEKRIKKESRQSSSHIGRMENEDSRDKLEINIMLRTVNTRTAVSVKALLDSGATGLFLEDSFVKEMGWDADNMERSVPFFNVDGTLNAAGRIRQTIDLFIRYGEHQ